MKVSEFCKLTYLIWDATIDERMAKIEIEEAGKWWKLQLAKLTPWAIVMWIGNLNNMSLPVAGDAVPCAMMRSSVFHVPPPSRVAESLGLGLHLCVSCSSDSSLAAAVAMAPFDSRFDPRQRRHLIHAQLVSQLIRVQLVLLDWGIDQQNL